MKILRIYFGGSIRGGRRDVDTYSKLIKYLKKYGKVLTEHVGDKSLTSLGENLDDTYIHDRDIDLFFSSDVAVMEVSTPSRGVSYEIGRGVERKVQRKKSPHILCLYKPRKGEKLSGMINGCPATVRYYNSIEEAKSAIDEFFKNLRLCKKSRNIF